MEYPGYKFMPIWDAGSAGGGLACDITMLPPLFSNESLVEADAVCR